MGSFGLASAAALPASGITSDDYVLAIMSKSKAEVQLRVRAEPKKTSAMISGDGLLWSKSLPTSPVRISYETWMRRGHKAASLDHLEEFTAEMNKIPVDGTKGK